MLKQLWNMLGFTHKLLFHHNECIFEIGIFVKMTNFESILFVGIHWVDARCSEILYETAFYDHLQATDCLLLLQQERFNLAPL